MRLALISWLAAILASVAQAAEAPLDAATKRAAVERAATLLRQNYIYPERGEQAALAITSAETTGAYDNITDPTAFADRLTADIQHATPDRHLKVTLLVAAGAAPSLPRSSGGIVRADRLKGNIGYLKLVDFAPAGLFAVFADEVMARLADTDALIIDCRENLGGTAGAVVYLESFFLEPETHLNDVITRTAGMAAFATTGVRSARTPIRYLGKPVYVLTGKSTFSGGEEIAYELQALKRATVVGETTGGAANPGRTLPLVAGLRLFVPDGRSENPVTKTNWEGAGVTPDVAAPESEALKAALARIAAELKRPEAATGDVEARYLTLRSKAQPGNEEAIRRLIAQLAKGQPDYANMADDIAAVTRQVLPRMQADLTRAGPIEKIAFRDVSVQGADLYDIQFRNGLSSWIFLRGSQGRIAGFGFSTPQPVPQPPR